ncbi:MAG: hypothetical protein NVS3B14_12720 [Ktedonobacteraceae bacterium]
MQAGLPVVIDKPVAATATDAERLIATSKSTGTLCTVFQNRRWDNDFLTIRQLLASEPDMLGQIIRFESWYLRYRPAPRANGMDPQEDALNSGMRPGDAGWGEEPRERWGRLSTYSGDLHFDGVVETRAGAYETFYALLRDALLHGGEPPVNPADAVATLRVIEAARQSARNHTVIEMAH